MGLAACTLSADQGNGVGRQSAAVGGASVSTASSSYNVGATVPVDFAGMPMSQDWIAISQASPGGYVVTWQYTGDIGSGQLSFNGLAAGTYVARAYTNNDFVLVAESAPFDVVQGGSSATVSTADTRYFSDGITPIDYTGMPGNQDWITIAPEGSGLASYVAWNYTGDTESGTLNFQGLPAGRYVARAFTNNDFTFLAESAPFDVVDLIVGAAQPTYNSGQTVQINFNAAPQNQDWIAIAPQGSGAVSYVQWQYTGDTASGSLNFSGIADGTYVARLFTNNDFVLVAESNSFTVGGGGGGNAQVSTALSSYAQGASVPVDFSNMPNNQDWIAVYDVNAPGAPYVKWAYTGGGVSGQLSFSGLAPGDYVARAYTNNDFIQVGESGTFSVVASTPATISTALSSYPFGASVPVDFSGMPNNQDWIAIVPAAGGTYVKWAYTGGGTSGQVAFAGLAAGDYVARAYTNNDFIQVGESAVFTVTANAPASVSTALSSYPCGSPVPVDFSGMPGNLDWIAIFPAAGGTYVQWQYTGDAAVGQLQFSGLAPGNYVAHAYTNNEFVEVGVSGTFTVTP